MRAYLVTLQDAAVATGNGTAMLATGYASIAYQVSGTFVGTVTFEVTVDNTNWVATQAVNTATGAVATIATVPGIYVANVAGQSQARARVTWTSGTSVTVKAQAVDVGSMNLADIDVQGAEAITIASGGVASGAIASGAVASGAVASGAVASGAVVDGAVVTLGAKADAKSTATDTTAITLMQVAKQISASAQSMDTKLTTGTDIGDVDVLSISAGENHLGEVGGKSATVSVTPTLTVAGAYSANDFVGTSATAMTFAGVARVNAGSGVIVSAVLIDYALQLAPGELWLFDTAPAGLPADNAAFTLTDAATLIGIIPFSTYYASALNSGSAGLNLPISFNCVGGAVKDIYGVFVTRGTPTYASGDVTIRLQIAQD